MTEAEAAAYEKQRQLQEESQAKNDIHYDNVIWQQESYRKVVSRLRTSIVVDPPDGKVPPLTPLGQQRAAARAEAARTAPVRQRAVAQPRRALHFLGQRRPADARLDLSGEPADHADEECVRDQARDHARRPDCARWTARRTCRTPCACCTATRAGAGRATRSSSTRRISPTPRRSAGRRPRRARTFQSSRDLHVVERFTRTDADSILYQFTVEDPSTWTRPWSGEMMMRKWEGPIFEYACHEGNYGLGFILSAARAQEKRGAGE